MGNPLKFERDTTVGCKVMDLFSWYFGRGGCTTRTFIVGLESGVHSTQKKTAYEHFSKNLSAIQQSDQK